MFLNTLYTPPIIPIEKSNDSIINNNKGTLILSIIIDNINVFKADVKYKTNEWKEQHINEMLYILIQSFKEFQNNEYTFNVPSCVKQRTNDY